MSTGKSQRVSRVLDDPTSWRFTQIGEGKREVVTEGEWLEVTQFPTTVHVELLQAKKIPDPVSRSFMMHSVPGLLTFSFRRAVHRVA